MKPSVAKRSRIYTLINNSKWVEALQACESYPQEKEVAFEKAYCKYRTNQLEDALELVSQYADSSDPWKRLEAQVRYRMGDYNDCAEMYEAFYDEDSSDVGFLVNALASCVSGEQPKKGIQLVASQEEELEKSYELSFNLACALLEHGSFDEAEERLKVARQLCIAELKEDEEDAEEGEAPENEALQEDSGDLAAINVLLACLLQQKGQAEQAEELYTKLLRPRPTMNKVDMMVLATASNNLAALHEDGKLFINKLKLVSLGNKEPLDRKLTRKQHLQVLINKCLSFLSMRQITQANRELEQLRKAFPDCEEAVVLQAAIQFCERKPQLCEETLMQYAKEHPNCQEVLVALAQVCLQMKHPEKALTVLTELPVESRSRPRVLQAIAALRSEQTSAALVYTLREAIEFWTGQDDEEKLAAVLRIASKTAQELKDSAFAAEVLKLYLENIDGSDEESLCGLVSALVNTDVERAEEYAQRLQVPAFDHFDPEELEMAPIPKMSLLRKGEAVEAEAGAGEGQKKKKKRKKKIRYPKGFDPANPGSPPDPERWLPKRERTEYKKKMRKRDKHLLRGPQGALVNDDAAFRAKGPSTAQMDVASDKPKSRNKKGKK